MADPKPDPLYKIRAGCYESLMWRVEHKNECGEPWLATHKVTGETRHYGSLSDAEFHLKVKRLQR